MVKTMVEWSYGPNNRVLALDFRIQSAGGAGEKPSYGSQSKVSLGTACPLGVRRLLGNIR